MTMIMAMTMTMTMAILLIMIMIINIVQYYYDKGYDYDYDYDYDCWLALHNTTSGLFYTDQHALRRWFCSQAVTVSLCACCWE